MKGKPHLTRPSPFGRVSESCLHAKLTGKSRTTQRSCEDQPFSAGCSEMLRVFPSGSLNQATFAPVGEVQMLNSS
jgi:hypothetical protein